MGKNQTLIIAVKVHRREVSSLHRIRAAAGGVASNDAQVQLPFPRGGIYRWQATEAKLLQTDITKGGTGCKHSIQSEQIILVSVDHCKQINALKGTADKHGQ